MPRYTQHCLGQLLARLGFDAFVVPDSCTREAPLVASSKIRAYGFSVPIGLSDEVNERNC